MRIAMLILILALPFPSWAETNERWWAVAFGDAEARSNSYGAAWNFPTEETARAAAFAECAKRQPGSSHPCVVDPLDVGNAADGCFGVISINSRGPVSYDTLQDFNFGLETINTGAELRTLFRDYVKAREANHTWLSYTLEMYHCPRSGETWTR